MQKPTALYRSAFKPSKDPRAIEQIGAVVRLVLADVPSFYVEGAPRGLLAPIYRTTQAGKPCRAVHLLNISGRTLKAGAAVANPKSGELPMPALPAMTLHLLGRVSSAVLVTPENNQTLTLTVKTNDATSTIEVPASSFRTYGLVYAHD